MRRAAVRQHEVAAEPDPRLVQRSEGMQGETLAYAECTRWPAAHLAERLSPAPRSLPADIAVLPLQAPLSATTTNGLPSITATFTEVTPAIASVAGNEGHPEMRDFVKQSNAGPASLLIAFIPNASGDGQHASDFVITSGVNSLSYAALVDGGPCTCPQQCLLHAEALDVVTC